MRQALDLVRLTPLMERTCGRPEVAIGLIDGPVAADHPDLNPGNVRELPGEWPGACSLANSTACLHGTFVAGILHARRGSAAPAICPECTLILRPIFRETAALNGQLPGAAPQELAAAIMDCIQAGVRLINLSAAIVQPSPKGEHELQAALDSAAERGVIVAAAAGNQASVGSSSITRHPWVIPVAACDLRGAPLHYSNLGNSIGRRGLIAPGDRIVSLSAGGQSPAFSGTSAAAPFVSGAAALLFSEFPHASGAEVKRALTQAPGRRRVIVPPVLDAWGAFHALAAQVGRR